MSKHTIEVHGIEILVHVQGDEHFADLKFISKSLGLDFNKQLANIKNDDQLNESLYLIETTDEKGKSVRIHTMEMKRVFGYIMRIDYADVADVFKEKFVKYEFECYNALAEKLKGGFGSNFNFNIKPSQS